MKIKSDFITNSSSTSFIIINISKTVKTLENFVKENKYLLKKFKEEYNFTENKFNQKNMLQDAAKRNIIFLPNEEKMCTFGDEEGDVLGTVYDYILRDGGKSTNFRWVFKEYNR